MAPKKPDKAKSRRLIFFAVLPVILVALAGAYLVGEFGLPFGSHFGNYQRQVGTTQEKEKWASYIELPGLPNLHKVSDDLYRGAQPTTEGIKELEKLGIKTVINLRSMHSDRDILKNTGLAYEHIEMTTWSVEDDDIIRFLQIINNGNRIPVFVHCQHGADRTGTVCAIYRITVQGWSKKDAIEEMTKGGFGYHSIWKNLPDYVHKLDIEKIKHRAGLK